MWPSRSRPARCRRASRDTLAREVREATAELGISEERLDVHDFEVRTFPEHRQILELLIGLWEEWKPDAVLQPSLRDIHQDHQVIAEGLRAFKRTTILGYEIPGTTSTSTTRPTSRSRRSTWNGRCVRSRSTNRSSTAGTRTPSTSGTSPGRTGQRESRVCGGVRGLPSRGVSGTTDEPRRSRPAFEPGYGISQDEEGMLDWSWAEERLASSRNYWIVTTGGDGAPAAARLGCLVRGTLYFGTNPQSLKGNLSRDPRVVIHLESGDEVVILRGRIAREDLPRASSTRTKRSTPTARRSPRDGSCSARGVPSPGSSSTTRGLPRFDFA